MSAEITLVGSGLAGPLLAIELEKRGYGVRLFERRPDMRKHKIAAGRSINLAISTRGIHALRAAGLWEEMQRIIIPMRGRMMHAVSGELSFMPYGKDESEVINAISRAELNIALMNAAERRGVKIEFNQKCTGYDPRKQTVRLRDEDSGRERELESEVVIGTDGSASAIRLAMQQTLPRFNLSQQHLDYGYKELTIPAGPGGKHQLEINALHIWPRGAFMLIALPNIDGTFGCILFLPFEGPGSFAELDSDAKVKAFFEKQFPDALKLMPGLIENYNANPVGAMVTVKCSPWHIEGKALLLGDAAHAIVPFFGQGINAGFEDITVLLELMDGVSPAKAGSSLKSGPNGAAEAAPLRNHRAGEFATRYTVLGTRNYPNAKRSSLVYCAPFGDSLLWYRKYSRASIVPKSGAGIVSTFAFSSYIFGLLRSWRAPCGRPEPSRASVRCGV